jgi:hypothetical protein
MDLTEKCYKAPQQHTHGIIYYHTNGGISCSVGIQIYKGSHFSHGVEINKKI